MKTCKVCGQAAMVYIVDVVGGIPQEYYLCNKCAANMNIAPQHFQIENIFKEIMGSFGSLIPTQPKPVEDIKCGKCGMTYSEFKRTLRFGCEHDYDLFNGAAILDQIHGTHQHVGKSPKNKKTDIKIDIAISPKMPAEEIKLEIPVVKQDSVKIRAELQTKLDAAVKAEDYEAAAKLRDQIKALPKD